MNTLLQWHYLIFLLPFGIAGLLLLLSAVRGGGHKGVRGHSHGHGIRNTPTQHNLPRHTAKSGTAQKHTHRNRNKQGDGQNPLALLAGTNRAPLPLVISGYCLAWGLFGFWANRLLLHTETPTLLQMVPSLLIALGGGLGAGRLLAEVSGRIMPQESTSVVSQDELYGLVGRVVFPVTESGGRIRVYDENRTLHVHPCRIAPGHNPIEKGHSARIVDKDDSGHLIVEETA